MPARFFVYTTETGLAGAGDAVLLGTVEGAACSVGLGSVLVPDAGCLTSASV